MLKKLHLQNFKQFEAFTLHLRGSNILVGPNNSGKSTILDALRLLDACLRYARVHPPSLLDVPDVGVVSGYQITQANLPIPLANVCRNYSDDPAVIDYTLADERRLRLVLRNDAACRFYLLDDLARPRTGPAFAASFPAPLLIVPQLSPFEEEERLVTDATVARNRSTRLASRTFRNIWYRSSPEEFEEFQKLVEASWPKVSVLRPERAAGDQPLTMFYTESRKPREVYWAGYGFQVWLQMLMHVLRADPASTFVIDEPDIYLHPDLQKRFYRIISRRFDQYVIATHSTEIINDVDIGSIVSVDSSRKSGRRVSTDEEYQALYNYIGSKENAELAKLARARRIVFFEGDDKKLLRKFALKVGLETLTKDTDTLVIAAGGFSQWRRVENTAWALREVLQIDAEVFSIFDRDYRSENQLDELIIGLAKADIRCRIWGRKELESYCLSLPTLQRLLNKRGRAAGISFSATQLQEQLLALTDAHAEYTERQLLDHAQAHTKEVAAVAVAKERFEKWSTLEGRFEIGPGKQMLKDICGHYKSEYNISLSAVAIVEEMLPEEVPTDMVEVLAELDQFCADEVSSTLAAMD